MSSTLLTPPCKVINYDLLGEALNGAQQQPQGCTHEFKSSLRIAKDQEEGTGDAFDLAVSHFSLSELSEELQLQYAAGILLKAKRSHLLMNYPGRCGTLMGFLVNSSMHIDVRREGFSAHEANARSARDYNVPLELWIVTRQ